MRHVWKPPPPLGDHAGKKDLYSIVYSGRAGVVGMSGLRGVYRVVFVSLALSFERIEWVVEHYGSNFGVSSETYRVGKREWRLGECGGEVYRHGDMCV